MTCCGNGEGRRLGAKPIRHRVRKAGLPADIRAYRFGGIVMDGSVCNGGKVEVAARIRGDESTPSTQLYNGVPDGTERIHIRIWWAVTLNRRRTRIDFPDGALL